MLFKNLIIAFRYHFNFILIDDLRTPLSFIVITIKNRTSFLFLDCLLISKKEKKTTKLKNLKKVPEIKLYPSQPKKFSEARLHDRSSLIFPATDLKTVILTLACVFLLNIRPSHNVQLSYPQM